LDLGRRELGALEAALHLADAGAAVGGELPVEGAVEGVLGEVGVGGDGVAQGGLAVLEAVLAVQGVQRGQVQPGGAEGVTVRHAPQRALEHGEGHVVLALGQSLSGRFEVDLALTPEQHGATLPRARVLHEPAATAAGAVLHGPRRPAAGSRTDAARPRGRRPGARAPTPGRAGAHRRSTVRGASPGATGGQARWNDSTSSRSGMRRMKVSTERAWVAWWPSACSLRARNSPASTKCVGGR